MTAHDWNLEAATMAEHIAANGPRAPLGATVGRQARVSVVFGNDPERSAPELQDDVSRVQQTLEEAGIRILGFGQDLENGYTWAMIVESEDLPLLNDLIGVNE
jgi:hypothetical protein